nr:hypothetical protein [uncultured Draconibacterium sp.]
MKDVIVLGARLVGSSIAKDLSKKHQATSVDFDKRLSKSSLVLPK